MQTVGHQLRTRREQRDQTLDAAARATRIPRHALRALEDDRFDDLAAPVYARGFLRNYAAWLGLDADGVLASYEEQQAVRQGLALGVEPSDDEGPVRLPGYFQASPRALRALTPAQIFLLLVTAATLVVFMLSVTVTIGLAPFAWAVWVPPTLEQLGWLFLVAVFATAGHFTMTMAFKAAPLTVTQPITFLQLVWATLLGALAFGEPADIWVILGGAMIIAAISYITLREAMLRRRQVTPAVPQTKL